MKRIINIFIAAVLVLGFATSCKKAPKVEAGIVSEWQLVEMTGYDAADLPVVYIEFAADKNFVIYQKVGDVARFRKYNGTYSVGGSTVSGEYSDGKKWGCKYSASIEADGEVLVMTALETDKSGNVLSEGEVCRYVKASLSKEEKDAAYIVTKSVDEPVRFL